MNFVLIPFFLAANVVVDDLEKWRYGLVAHYNADIVVTLGATEDTMQFKHLSTTLTCRQSAIDELMCSLPRILTDKPQFLVKFDANGIKNFLFQEVVDHMKLAVIRSIMKELSIGVDLLQYANALPAFVANENYVLGDCSTLFTVLQDVGSTTFSDFDEKRNFELNILSLPQRKPSATVIIEKRTDSKRCNGTSHNDVSSATTVTFKRSVTKMHIGSNTFVSENKMTPKVRKLKENRSFIIDITTRLELLGIEPATEELPSLTVQEVETLQRRSEQNNNIFDRMK